MKVFTILAALFVVVLPTATLAYECNKDTANVCQAGFTWDEESGWSDDSIYGRCQSRLEEMVRLLRLAGKPDEKGSADNQEETDDGSDGDHVDH